MLVPSAPGRISRRVETTRRRACRFGRAQRRPVESQEGLKPPMAENTCRNLFEAVESQEGLKHTLRLAVLLQPVVRVESQEGLKRNTTVLGDMFTTS